MEPIRSIEELTRRNVAIIAEMEKAAAHVRTRGDWVADRIAAWVGSWTFLITQSVILLLWIGLNIAAWVNHWDPYPFVLLNLALSFQSAYAAPILMISQNRQAKLNERRNHLDLQINMLAEQESTEILRFLRLLCEHSGVRLDKDNNGRAFEEETKHAEIVRQIQGELEEQTGETAQVPEEVDEERSVTAVAVSKHGRLLAAASRDRTVRLCDLNTHQPLDNLPHESVVDAVAFNRDSTRLAPDCEDNPIRLWDVATRPEVAKLRGHKA
jgi:uncharacterized membrane protein